ncbi:MAG: SNF2-related protein [Microbacterium sp.]
MSAPGERTPVPDGLNAHLRPYQRDGLDRLALWWRYGVGGILADDMGLGKTLQVLALFAHARAAEAAGDSDEATTAAVHGDHSSSWR